MTGRWSLLEAPGAPRAAPRVARPRAGGGKEGRKGVARLWHRSRPRPWGGALGVGGRAASSSATPLPWGGPRTPETGAPFPHWLRRALPGSPGGGWEALGPGKGVLTSWQLPRPPRWPRPQDKGLWFPLHGHHACSRQESPAARGSLRPEGRRGGVPPSSQSCPSCLRPPAAQPLPAGLPLSPEDACWRRGPGRPAPAREGEPAGALPSTGRPARRRAPGRTAARSPRSSSGAPGGRRGPVPGRPSAAAARGPRAQLSRPWL